MIVIEQGNIVTYRPGEKKYGYVRFVRKEGLPRSAKFTEKTDPDAYGLGMVLDIVKCADVQQPQSWAYKCVIKLDTKADADFAVVYWCGNSVLEFVDTVFLDVVKQHATVR